MSRGRPSVKEGRLVGVDDGRGYMRLQVNHRKYYVHQIVFLLHHGFLPKCIDHADGNQKNNKIDNLRAATVSENMRNTKRSTINTSGVKGVHFNKQKLKWQAKLTINGKQIARVFDSKELAIDFMELFREIVHGQFANHGIHKGA
jgi:hypothetical protein